LGLRCAEEDAFTPSAPPRSFAASLRATGILPGLQLSGSLSLPTAAARSAPQPHIGNHELIVEFDCLIVLTGGDFDLDLYRLICRRVAQWDPPLHEIVIDLSDAVQLTDWGSVALLALDRYAESQELLTFVITPRAEIRAQLESECRWIKLIS